VSTGKIMAKPGGIAPKTRVLGGYPWFSRGESRKLRAESGLRFGAFQNMLV